jgi:son of sevenless
MKLWVDTYTYEDEEDRKGIQVISQFVSSAVQEANLAHSLRLSLDRYEPGQKMKPSLGSSRDVPPPILPRNLKKIKLTDLDSLEIARQLTIIESKEYQKLRPIEFLMKAWSDKESNVAVNVKAMIATSNQVSGWVALTILSEKDVKKRASLIKLFINIAEVSNLIIISLPLRLSLLV